MDILNYNVKELKSSEIEELQGGFWKEAIGAVIWIVDNWDDIEAGYHQGFNDYAN
ncbi:hypothetical protein OOZ15_03035 [Galbibacter sp. EGI 63066]|uniref:hypothetical protein n=1 Tax=Galbibacter sp. EGI 63066 TaxID=2993559 RepID=UPI0022491B06|nr:hypothetical protein [Galbibacter sp. EGI 63066]MCX2678904.1 hypothetical protein [Galbibacter sp. EGI 63066]